jgi:hypothetical protein
MSAFMVADETINRSVSWLEREIHRSSWLGDKLTDYHRSAEQANSHGSLGLWEQALAERMFHLNLAALEARYGKAETVEYKERTFRYVPVAPQSDIQALKSINCWLYQCMEGDIPSNPLYRFFDDIVVRYLLEKFVYNSPAYDTAVWG